LYKRRKAKFFAMGSSDSETTQMSNASDSPPKKTQKKRMDDSGKTIEQIYQKKSQLEHILIRPDTYIGSVEEQTAPLWVFEDGKMVHKSISYVPGLYKIFDEIIVNGF
jgi:DNA topoisomerase-2